MRSAAVTFLLSYLASATLLAAALKEADKSPAEPHYDPASVVDISGTVVSVREVPQGSRLGGLHLLVSTETGEIEAYLGPSEFVKEFEITFSKGDDIQIVGSKVSSDGGYLILVREVRKGDIFLYLRDRTGHPNWPARPKPTT